MDKRGHESKRDPSPRKERKDSKKLDAPPPPPPADDTDWASVAAIVGNFHDHLSTYCDSHSRLAHSFRMSAAEAQAKAEQTEQKLRTLESQGCDTNRDGSVALVVAEYENQLAQMQRQYENLLSEREIEKIQLEERVRTLSSAIESMRRRCRCGAFQSSSERT
eukprot:gnl/Spiro4/15059_TR8119_c0_g1_i1.p1 gnl/Spiro4/15059_TR8119_c0_g1~~gnl/Spiro4/15059_TR8119_c0_g1_i1.p1  ORF type:complete len:180 (+),score=24.90 gnl/Spiro4/15059_TR8119_c0_g1_i1:52-540(+)